MAGWHTYTGVDGVWDTGGNWNPAGPPGAGDDVMFPANFALGPTTSPSVLVKYLSLTTAKQCSMNIGSSGSPITLASEKIDIGGLGNVFIKNDEGGASNFVTELIVRPQNSEAQVVMSSDDGDAGEYNNILVMAGDFQIDSGGGSMALMQIAEMLPGSIRRCQIAAASGTLALLIVGSGSAEAANAITTTHICPGGTLTKTDAAIGTIYNAGTLFYNDDGDIALLHALPGSTTDFTQAPVTDTDGLTVIDLYEWPGSTVKEADHVIVTNRHRIT